MKLIAPIFYTFLILISFNCCSDQESPTPNNSSLVNTNDINQWLIPTQEVFDGGPGKDGIPAIDDPKFESANANFIQDSDLVVGIAVGNEAHAYPHFILDWHEIVNDQIEKISLAVVYCPLTGTALGWDRNVGGVHTTFGVSGLLYNTNIIPYDRSSGSNWSQIRMECVNGALIKTEPKAYQVVETTWGTWKKFFPNTEVMSTNTGHSRDYGRYPYGSYKTNESLLFPISDSDDRLHAKERVHAIIMGTKAKAYRFDSFEEATVVQDQFRSSDVIVIGSKKDNFIASFEGKSIDGELLVFHIPEDLKLDGGFNSSILMEDQLGNRWNIFGLAVSGPNQEEQLTPTRSMMGYWFSFHPFYPSPEIFDFSGN